MAKGQPRDPRQQQFWRDHLSRWHASGLTIRDYCARHHLSEPSFYAWRRTLAQRDRPVEAAAVVAPVTFVPLQVQPDRPAMPPALELVLANGRRLRIPSGSDPRQLRELLAVLEDEPC